VSAISAYPPSSVPLVDGVDDGHVIVELSGGMEDNSINLMDSLSTGSDGFQDDAGADEN
jgi:hypothetical protein